MDYNYDYSALITKLGDSFDVLVHCHLLIVIATLSCVTTQSPVLVWVIRNYLLGCDEIFAPTGFSSFSFSCTLTSSLNTVVAALSFQYRLMLILDRC